MPNGVGRREQVYIATTEKPMSRNHTEWTRRPDLPDDHYVSSEVYTSEAIYKDELANIFRKTWQLACHESELPLPGDYRALKIADTPVIVIRGDDGKVRCFLNACSHRSSMLVYQPAGNCKRIVCPFHLWTYNTAGDCVERTRDIGYEKCGPPAKDLGLRELRTDLRYGLVFVNFDDDACSLEEASGEAWDIIDDVLGPEELEVFHYHQFIVNANWKQWQETDMELYHEWGHPVNRRTSLLADGYYDRKWTIHPNGHGSLTPFIVKYANYKGWSDRNSKSLPGLRPNEYRILDMFPNISIMMRATTLRIDTSTPIGPHQTLVQFRGFGIKGESAEDRETRVKHHNQFWGPFGRNLPEDVLFVEGVAPNNRSGSAKYPILARHEDLKTQDDEVMRAYYRTWARYMGRTASDPRKLTKDEPRRVAEGAQG